MSTVFTPFYPGIERVLISRSFTGHSNLRLRNMTFEVSKGTLYTTEGTQGPST